MNHHETACNAIEAAIDVCLQYAAGPVEHARAEAMTIAYLSVDAISPAEFTNYCERIRRIVERRKEFKS